MSEPRDRSTIRISLTFQQAEQVKAAIGREADAIELTAQELEQRIVPTIITFTPVVPPSGALAANSNEALLLEPT